MTSQEAKMFTKVLIGVDGRQGGRDAIALARQLAAPAATLTLGHVCAPILGQGAVEALPWQRAEARKLLTRERGRAAVDAQLAVRDPFPVGPGLHELAEQQAADLLVVGSTRHALVGRVLLGDGCRAALDGAPCAIAVAPRGYALAPHRLKRVGVGYDGSPESERALGAAHDLASEAGAAVTVMWVVPLQDARTERPVPSDWPGAIEDLIDRHAERLAGLHDVHGLVAYGGPREELVRLGKHVDLLIVGSRDHGPIGRLVHGSVSRYLVGHAPCPLLVLPRGAAVASPPRGPEREVHLVAGSV
jgi:nucleotide-binding universal stress UspA family protein